MFISGGVRSGKSSFSEQKAYSLLSREQTKLIYIATSNDYDPEMKQRIQKHQDDRNSSGHTWETWEQSTDLEILLDKIEKKHVLLLDCLTTLLANELFINLENWKSPLFRNKLIVKITGFINEVKKRNIPLVIVSNELLNAGINYDEGTFHYLKMIGQLHQQIVAMADEVYLVEASIPLKMKG